ncbi:hypothetical protein [Burkholderia stabilis]|uniref:hypothetical protein n=1 Tax=Burkholderia stabilis TaxID=95485 RepID=UPI001F4B9B82|nr:hypothetical protein [Burkholderia stabilis]
MTDLQLAAFALPPTFPPELVPEACAQFVRDCVPGLTRRQLLARTRARGWRPTWQPLPHLVRDELEAFGFSLTVDGFAVPLIARMRRVGQGVQPATVSIRDPGSSICFDGNHDRRATNTRRYLSLGRRGLSASTTKRSEDLSFERHFQGEVMNGLTAAASVAFALSLGCVLHGWAVPASAALAACVGFPVYSLKRQR